MKKQEIEGIYKIFVECLPKGCRKSRGIVVYNSFMKMMHDIILSKTRSMYESFYHVEVEDVVMGDVIPSSELDARFPTTNFRPKEEAYPRSTRLRAIHQCSKLESKYPWAAIATDPVSIYSRGIENKIDLLWTLLHETAHLNGCNCEDTAEEWAWRRWPYVYGKYKKLKGE